MKVTKVPRKITASLLGRILYGAKDVKDVYNKVHTKGNSRCLGWQQEGA